MSTVFIGGSRHISRLSPEAKERLENIVRNNLPIVVGDAAGADKAVQKFLLDAGYASVTVYCSGDQPRNNLGDWETCKVAPGRHVKGFQFYAAKDREMAKRADFGLMIWDGKSSGTALNVLRLLQAGKKAVLLNVPEKQAITFKSSRDWSDFLSQCGDELMDDLRSRATPEEWRFGHAPSSEPVEAPQPATSEVRPALAPIDIDPTVAINAALATGDLATVVETLGTIAKAHGMTHVAKDAGLARESLYRSLNAGGNPEFSTVMKVMSSLGLQLSVSRATQQ